MNLLPIPALDGSQLLIILIEKYVAGRFHRKRCIGVHDWVHASYCALYCHPFQ